ncbi:MAG: tetratricopeptide repeat protein [Spirochaetota bacterium]|nr:MAG: tetratricopeptide repeat protein [Spirochaetota bacterium]
MPDPKDLEKIEQILGKLGENELEIGQVEEGEYIPKEVLPPEELPTVSEEVVPGTPETEPDLDELLKDIEIGLREEKELEKKPGEEAEVEAEPEVKEGITPPEEIVLPEEALPTRGPELEEEEAVEEEIKEAEGEAPSEPEVEAPEAEGILELPGGFDFGDLDLVEGPHEEIFKPKEKIKKPEEEIPPAEVEIEGIPAGPAARVIPEEEVAKEEEMEAAEFDLPADFDMGDLEMKEGPPEGIFKEAAEEAPPVKKKEEVEAAEEELEKEEIEVAEEGLEKEEIEMPELEELEALEEALEKEEVLPPAEEEAVSIDELEFADIEKGPVPEKPAKEKVSEEVVSEMEAVMPEEEREKGAIEIELSDEDIVIVTTKIKQLDPNLAIRIRDIIIGETLAVEAMTELIGLLVGDAPEKEIVELVELLTGEKVVPRARVPEVITVPRRPTAITRIVENLGPVVRVAGLFVVILAIVTILFMVFIYKPMRAGRYYKEGIELLRIEQYSEAELNFKKAVNIYEKVKEYNNFGWEYMVSGNYSEAMIKFQQGIEKDVRVKNLDIRLNSAKLHNILGNYEQADQLYDVVIEHKPKVYEFIELKGLNLIDWGKIEPEHLNSSYILFKEEFAENQKSPDPLFPMLYIHILRKDEENIDYLYDLLTERYPRVVDKKVFTELAEHYLTKEDVDSVRAIMADVIQADPDYPEAYYTFSKYYKIIKNKTLQEELLKRTIEFENARELVYPWEARNRELLSNAYNDLGEIYAGMDIPGMSAEAIKYFKQAIEEKDQNVKSYFNLAQVFFYGEKNYDMARTYYELAKRMGFENNDLMYNLGILYFYNKDFGRALRQWSELTETMLDNPNINYAIGSALLHLGEYSSALGELLVLDELYDDLVKRLGEIKPWRAYHKRIVLEASRVSNNLGVAYQKLYEITGDPEYQKKSLVSLYKGGELADIIGIQRGEIQYNINYIIHPEVIRGDMAINSDVSHDYRFFTQ